MTQEALPVRCEALGRPADTVVSETASEDADDDAPTRADTPAMEEPTTKRSIGVKAVPELRPGRARPSPPFRSRSTTTPPFEGESTIVSLQAFPDDDADDRTSLTATRTRSPALGADATTAPATPALLSRGAWMVDALASPAERSITAVGLARAYDATPRAAPETTRRRPVGITRPIARHEEARRPQVVERRAWKEQDDAHRELARRVMAAPGVPEAEPESERLATPVRDSRARCERRRIPVEHRETARHPRPDREVGAKLPLVESPGLLRLQMGLVVAAGVLCGVLLALWWTGVSAVDEGLSDRHSPSMPAADGWAVRDDPSRGPVPPDRLGDSVVGSLEVGADAVSLSGKVEGVAFRLASASRDVGRPVTERGAAMMKGPPR